MTDPVTNAYFAGYEWAGKHIREISEYYSSKELGQDLKDRLYEEAKGVYPAGEKAGCMAFRKAWMIGVAIFIVDRLPVDSPAYKEIEARMGPLIKELKDRHGIEIEEEDDE